MRREILGLVTAVMWMTLSVSPVSAADLDCRDFGTREAAEQAIADEGGVDTNALDADGDGQPCERLPSGAWYAAVGALLAAAATLLVVHHRREGSWPRDNELAEVLFGPFVVAVPAYLILPEIVKRVAPASTDALIYGLLGAGVAIAVVLAVKANTGEL